MAWKIYDISISTIANPMWHCFRNGKHMEHIGNSIRKFFYSYFYRSFVVLFLSFFVRVVFNTNFSKYSSFWNIFYRSSVLLRKPHLKKAIMMDLKERLVSFPVARSRQCKYIARWLCYDEKAAWIYFEILKRRLYLKAWFNIVMNRFL